MTRGRDNASRIMQFEPTRCLSGLCLLTLKALVDNACETSAKSRLVVHNSRNPLAVLRYANSRDNAT
jgi:hypothetical protein